MNTLTFIIVQLLVAAAIFYGCFASIRNLLGGKKGKALVCTTCGHNGPTRVLTRGSLLIEIALWLCIVVPGLIYSIWRLTSRAPACSSCGAVTLVPADSPIGRKLLATETVARPSS